MQRWNFDQMMQTSRQLFDKIYRRKQFSDPNHEIHFLAREVDAWLPNTIQSLIDGDYAAQPIRRYYFEDEVVDQLEINDRIAQHVLLKELKPTFKHIVHSKCYHMLGPTGVKRATRIIEQALKAGTFRYIIRADVKSFYRSIPHYKLIQDIKEHYNDPKILRMLSDIIRKILGGGR